MKFQRESGTAAVTVCGTTGEAATMTPDERYDAVSFCKRAAGHMEIVAGAGGNSTAATVETAQACEAAGADAVLIVTPYYNRPTQSGLIAHFVHVADSVSIPVILYNVPSRTGVSIAAETYQVLAAHPNINGVKEASGSFRLMTEVRRLCGDDLTVWSGNDDITVPMMAMGAKGVISVAANIVPGAMAAMTSLALKGDFPAAAALQLHYAELIEALFCETNPIPVKAAMAKMGLCGGALRLPMTELSGERKKTLYSAMERVGLY